MAGERGPVPPPGRASPAPEPAEAGSAGTRRSRTGPVLAAVVVAGYAAVAGSYPSFSAAATVAVLAPGVALLGYAVAVGPRHPRLPARRVTRRGAVLWAIPVLIFSALEIVDDKLGSTWEHPTLSVLMDPLLAHQGGRSAAMAVWLAVGIAVARL